jgi:hypothetical protein
MYYTWSYNTVCTVHRVIIQYVLYNRIKGTGGDLTLMLSGLLLSQTSINHLPQSTLTLCCYYYYYYYYYY